MASFFASFLFIYGCEREEIIEEDVDTFLEFGYIESKNPYLIEQSDVEIRGNAKKKFKKKLKKFLKNHPNKKAKIKKMGHISWDNIQLHITQDGIDFYAVPVIKNNSEHCEAVVLGAMGGEKFNFTLLTRKKVKKLAKKQDQNAKIKFLTKELCVAILGVFDTKLFGHTDCELLDLAREGVDNDAIVKTRGNCEAIWGVTNNCAYVGSETWINGSQVFIDHHYDCYESYEYAYVCDYTPGWGGGSGSGGGTPPADVPEEEEEEEIQFELIFDGVCSSSIHTVKTSYGYTACTSNIIFEIKYLFNSGEDRHINLGDMCIQIGSIIYASDATDENNSRHYIAEAITSAGDALKKELRTYYDETVTDLFIRNEYIKYIRDAIRRNTTRGSVASGRCLDVPCFSVESAAYCW